MGQSFKIAREELLNFAKKLYQEACYGYLDLCDPVTERMVTDFLDGRVPMEGGILSGFPASTTMPAGFTYTTEPLNVTISAGGPPDPASAMGGPPMREPPPGPPPGMQEAAMRVLDGGIRMTASSGHTISFEDHPAVSPPVADMATAFETDGIIFRETPIVREEIFVRSNDVVGDDVNLNTREGRQQLVRDFLGNESERI